jgi:hypothetical protein
MPRVLKMNMHIYQARWAFLPARHNATPFQAASQIMAGIMAIHKAIGMMFSISLPFFP